MTDIHMTDIQVIEPARNKYFARPEHRDPPRAMVNSTRAGHTLREGSARTVAKIGQLWEGPSAVYHLWQRVKSGEAEALHVR
jgi:hypothetical protein